MFPASPVEHVDCYTAVRYLRIRAESWIPRQSSRTLLIPNLTIPIPNRTTNEITEIRLQDIGKDITFPQR